jgi:hypothetical protein
MTPDIAFWVVVAFAAGGVVLAWWYFRRFRISRPPIGVFNLRDVALMIGAIVLVPFLYVAVPAWLAATLLGLGLFSVLHVSLEPVLPGRGTAWIAALALLAADVVVAQVYGAPSWPFLFANNTVLMISIIGAANLWAQSGMKARDAAVLGAALTIYDFVATSVLPLMNDLIGRLASLPFTPQITGLSADSQWLGVGLGDLLLASVFPLVMRKAFGRNAGLLALCVGLVTLAAMLVLLDLRIVRITLPAMVALGPLMVAQYIFWTRRLGRERTTRAYLDAEPQQRKHSVEPATSLLSEGPPRELTKGASSGSVRFLSKGHLNQASLKRRDQRYITGYSAR